MKETILLACVPSIPLDLSLQSVHCVHVLFRLCMQLTLGRWPMTTSFDLQAT